MKKHITVFTLFILLITLSFASCKNKDKSTANSEISSGVSTNDSTENLITDEHLESGDTNSSETKIENGSIVNNSGDNNSTASTKPQSNSSKVSNGSSNSSAGSTSSKNEDASSGGLENKMLTYKEYLNLSAAEREAYYRTFDSVKEFAEWHENAKKEYEKEDDSIHVSGNGTLNLEDYY